MTKLLVVPKIGKVAEKAFYNLGVTSLEDSLFLLPRSYDNRKEERRLKDASVDNPTINCKVYVISHSSFASKNRGKTLKIKVADEDGRELELLCFNRNFLDKMLTLGSSWYIHATVTKQSYQFQSASFEIKRRPEDIGLGRILPIYPLTEGLKEETVRLVIQYALKNLPKEMDIIPQEILEKYNFMEYNLALFTIHNPQNIESIERARKSLAFHELLLLELSLIREKGRKKVVKQSSRGLLENRFLSSLNFTLTQDQQKVSLEINEDLDSNNKMNRLLQGDVGSGKTLVAFLSALHVIEKGGQVAMMAPTELLARQHAIKAAELLSKLGIRVALITGDTKGKGRKILLDKLKNGEVDLIVGTHALFSNEVEFKNLKYIVIDEQHRFGVNQRKALEEKGKNADLLSMTATPIPRTLALTIFADMDISTIKTMPNGRIPIKTHIVSENHREKMYKAIGVEFLRSHQAYFVYPRIDDEGESDLRDVMSMYEFLKKEYPNVPSKLVHSKLPDEEKAEILEAFKEKKISYLVSTSVIEVGIDIPDATCIVIEHADRFGLAALHQLRGRVGRSSLPSYCFLVTDVDHLSEDAKERLKVMRDTNDGFIISEKDLEIRGPGEITGNKQSGFLKLKFSSLTEDYEIVEIAKEVAEAIIKEDPGLIQSKNTGLRNALSKMKAEVKA